MPLNFERLHAPELSALPRDRTLFIFALGVHEDHGPHLPIGMDLLESGHLARRAAERIETEMPGWTAVLMPALPLSVNSGTTALAFPVRAHVVRDYLVDVCLGLGRNGFRFFTVMSGQWGPHQITAIEDAGRILSRKSRKGWLNRVFRRSSGRELLLVGAQSACIAREEAMRSPLWPSPLEHGGARDTSVALAIASDQVASAYLGLPEVTRTEEGLPYLLQRLRHQVSGYLGKPSAGDAQRGEELIRDQLDTLVPKLRAVIAGSNPAFLFRSWYSIFPSNRSLFKAWVLALGIGLILIAWMALSISMMVATP